MSVKVEFVDLFRNSQWISTIKGKSNFFFTKSSKPNNEQIKIKNIEEEKKEITLKSISLNRETKFIQVQIDKLEGMQRDHEENLDKLSNLYSLGVIDEDGNLVNNKME